MNTKILSSLQRQCSRREYCSSEVRAKALKTLSEDEAAEVVASLVADGFVSDLRYATAFARDKASLTGWGPIKIKAALRLKGISAADISEALGAIDSDSSSERLGRLLTAKARTLEGDPARKLKLIRFALSRGYEYDAVAAAVEKLLFI